MILKNEKFYLPIFSELAKFLVDKSTYKVYYVYSNSNKKEKVLLNKENVDRYCSMFDETEKSGVAGGCLFMYLGDLPPTRITFSNHINQSIKLESIYNEYNWLNW